MSDALDTFDPFDPFSSSSSAPTPAQNGTGVNNTNSSTGGTIVWPNTPINNSWPFPVGNPGNSGALTIPQAKYKVQYIIELTDGNTLELKEQQLITPREMIGLCKFINMVSIVQQSSIKVMWSDLITELAIDRHFVSGVAVSSYIDADTQYVFLIDEM